MVLAASSGTWTIKDFPAEFVHLLLRFPSRPNEIDFLYRRAEDPVFANKFEVCDRLF